MVSAIACLPEISCLHPSTCLMPAHHAGTTVLLSSQTGYHFFFQGSCWCTELLRLMWLLPAVAALQVRTLLQKKLCRAIPLETIGTLTVGGLRALAEEAGQGERLCLSKVHSGAMHASPPGDREHLSCVQPCGRQSNATRGRCLPSRG